MGTLKTTEDDHLLASNPVETCTGVDTDDYIDLIGKASVLVVGAGGIGCEVIKILVLCGVRKLVVVDLDTIDVSNLNRQFLYRREDVGSYKAHIACERVRELAPGCDVSAKVCDVLKWRPQDVADYDLVLNALDNVRARSHINYCCMRAGVPLIESGSTGFNGQVYPIVHGITPCYDCHDKPRTKSIPVCTIRQIPEKPEHCVAWARHLYELMFGTESNSNVLSDLALPVIPAVDGLTEHIAHKWVRDVFTFLFDTQISSLSSLGDTWKDRQPPACISYPFTHGDYSHTSDGVNGSGTEHAAYFDNKGESNVELDCAEIMPPSKVRRIETPSIGSTKQGRAVSAPVYCMDNTEKQLAGSHLDIHNKMRISTTEELCEHFRDALLHIINHRREAIGQLMFDKDDALCMQFVASAANLRMINFHIPHLSAWDVQSIAGAITPAIAATNSIVAASQVMQLAHLLKTSRWNGNAISHDQFRKSRCSFVWIRSCVTGSTPLLKGALCSPETLDKPNAKCIICQQKLMRAELRTLDEWTLASFASKVCVDRLKMGMVNIDFDGRNILDSEFMEDDSAYANKIQTQTLPRYGISHQSILTVTCLDTGRQEEIQVVEEGSLSSGGFHLVGCDP
ncbi:ubiquitin-like 1-activating enzyme E1 B [Babesia ovis]|uniref:SUMO-activating enzyme subunit n=1 Tax=Babesia ovis TaxID=5869 RepID=A0A9W5TCU9_BABOV|nr:ubiquitin-like 1-activating enzyme E1 B [Babesia ovis]